MTADSPSSCLVERLNTAIDRLDIAIEAFTGRLQESATASAALDAMADDRSTLAHELETARTRVAELERAVVEAGDELTDSASAVKDMLGEEETF
jgi:ABC-type transporter Mla subunit MlaD